MAQCGEYNFWKNPQLAEKLISFLDTGSLRCLAEAHKLSLKTLQRASVWNKLLSRTFLCRLRNETMLEEEALLAKASALAEILKMFEESKPLRLDLLHMICKRFPSDNQVKGITGSQFVNLRLEKYIDPDKEVVDKL